MEVLIVLFVKLINSSFKRNLKFYLPYLVTMTILVAINYIAQAMANNHSLRALPSGQITKSIFELAILFIVCVTLASMLYINRFLWQQRRQEMGLYSLLGMTSKNLAWLTVLEKNYLFVMSLITGLVFGVIFERLAFLSLARLLKISHLHQSWWDGKAILTTTCLIVLGFMILMVIDLIKLWRLQPQTLWHPQAPQTKHHGKLYYFGGLLGFIALIIAYYLTVTMKPKFSALQTFMLAVLLVIIGTYLVFIAGITLVLKRLQKRPNYYYQPRHFIAVSGMLQRMDQNGASLGTICLLCSSVLVMLFASLTLYVGINDTTKAYAPQDLTLVTNHPLNTKQTKTLHQVAKQYHAALKAPVSFETSQPQYGYWQGRHFINQGDFNHITTQTSNTVIYLSATTYQRLTGKQVSLDHHTALVYSPAKHYTGQYRLADQTYQVKPIRHFNYYFNPGHSIFSPIFVVVNEVPSQTGKSFFTGINYHLAKSERQHLKFEAALQAQLGFTSEEFTAKASTSSLLTNLYGGIVFIGILLSLTLGVTTAIVIYFKQITEGYEDQQRFKTMQAVGLSENETTKSIRSQVLMVFLLPVFGAIVNLVFAIPAIRKILIQFSFYNATLMIEIAVIITIILLLIYLVIYGLTTQMYRQIVDQG